MRKKEQEENVKRKEREKELKRFLNYLDYNTHIVCDCVLHACILQIWQFGGLVKPLSEPIFVVVCGFWNPICLKELQSEKIDLNNFI